MKIGEVCLHTTDVVRLADFYKQLFEIDNGSRDRMHQMLICEETQFSIFYDGVQREKNTQHMSLAFTVEDIEAAYQKLLQMGADIVEKPTKRPWGTSNMSFYDPDHNLIYLRTYLK